ncbi:MAG: peptide chain release factor 3 [Deltaproteobacteria bacterium]|nr:peptide chain release factor 3 [Deltaproteobacteria bacterium]
MPLPKRLKLEVARRRTFAIISHPDAGKTTLTEKLLLYGGAIHLAGAVKARRAARHATSDWMELERARGISVTTSVMQFSYDDYCVNILDTPGHQDFSEDTYRTLAAADSAVMLIDAAKGVEPQTEKLFRVCRLRDLPIFTFVNKMDRQGREPLDLMDELETHLGMRSCPMNWPIFDGYRFVGVYERSTELVHLFEADEAHGASEIEERTAKYGTPECDALLTPAARARLAEDLELLDVAGDPFDLQRVRNGELTPLFFGSALTNFGVRPFLDEFLKAAPAPSAYPTEEGATVEATDTAFSGFVFKIQANMDQAHRDRIAFLRVCSGRFTKGMDARVPRLDKTIRLKNPSAFMARERSTIEEAFPGDIIGLYDPGLFRIGDTLTTGADVRFKGIPHFSPELFRRVMIADPLRRKQMYKGIEQLAEEGAIQMFSDWDSESPDIVGAVGTLQFDVLQSRLQIEYRVNARLETLPYQLCRWIVGPGFDPKKFQRGQGSSLARDRDGHPVLLLQNEWGIRWATEKNPDFKLLPVSPTVDHAGSLKG